MHWLCVLTAGVSGRYVQYLSFLQDLEQLLMAAVDAQVRACMLQTRMCTAALCGAEVTGLQDDCIAFALGVAAPVHCFLAAPSLSLTQDPPGPVSLTFNVLAVS